VGYDFVMDVPKYTLVEVLQDKWWIGVLALCVSLIATPIVRFIAYRLKIVDRPDDLLKPHVRPVAYLGGIAMCVGLLAGLGAYISIMPDVCEHWHSLCDNLSSGRLLNLLSNPLWNLFAIAAGSVLITCVGLVDDFHEIKPRTKVWGQIAAAVILLVGGVGDKVANVVFSQLGIDLPFWILAPLSALMCIVLVIATCNATNLLDGLDGLCGGVTGIIVLGFLGLSAWLAMWGHVPYHDSDQLRVALCLAMVGTVLGFLPYNIPPASIFMGDAGSMLLGFFVAAMMAMFCRESNARWFVAAWAVFALPTLDTGLAVVRRVLSRKSIFAGDRSHLYDQLVDRGMSIKRVVVLFYILAALAAVIGVVVAIKLRGLYAVILYLVLLAIIWTIFGLLGMITPEPRQPIHGDEQQA